MVLARLGKYPHLVVVACCSGLNPFPKSQHWRRWPLSLNRVSVRRYPHPLSRQPAGRSLGLGILTGCHCGCCITGRANVCGYNWSKCTTAAKRPA